MRSAVAFVVCAPLVTWVVTAIAAHPTLVGLAPPRIALAGAAVFLIALFWVAARGVVAREPLHPSYRAGLLFGAATLVASILGFDPVTGIAAAVVFCAIALAGNRLYRVALAGGWSALVTAWLCSGIGLCLVALAAVAARRPAKLFAFSHGRAMGIFENPNELALFALAVGAVAAGALFAGSERYRARMLAAAALIVAVVTLAATGSRSGEASFALGAVVLAMLLSRRRAALGAVAVVVLLGLALAYGIDRRHNPAENESRLDAWRAGIRTVALFPLTGVGIGAYYRIYPSVRAPDAPGLGDPIAFDPHNFYLAVASETGLLGLACFAWTILVFAREARASLTRAGPAEQRFVLAVVAGLIAVGLDLLFNAFALAIVLWVVMAALILGAPRSSRASPE